ncbi:Zn-ribbon domain-containing OB-fold protein [Streptomyces sp. NPDC058320]|uniref:Zn-ribbon domain-containing OB-fold protein n=1 Tax=unclassified Streptomyces TaxID=2593676 RepID=UPI00362965E5
MLDPMYVRTVQQEAPIGPPSTIRELRFQRCTWCSTIVFRTCLLCPTCASTDLHWERSEGRGKICSAVEVRRKGQRRRMVTVVELREGVRMRCEVEGAATGFTPVGTPVSVSEIAPDAIPVFSLDSVTAERW